MRRNPLHFFRSLRSYCDAIVAVKLQPSKSYARSLRHKVNSQTVGLEQSPSGCIDDYYTDGCIVHLLHCEVGSAGKTVTKGYLRECLAKDMQLEEVVKAKSKEVAVLMLNWPRQFGTFCGDARGAGRRKRGDKYQHQIFPNAGADVDDAMAAICAPLFEVPTTRMGTAGGFLRFGGGGGDRR